MDEDDIGKVTRPQENTSVNDFTYLPVEHMDPQNRCDLCKVLWLEEDRFTTKNDLPEQTLGHIQHTCETLSTSHIDTHHQCWCLIHGELTRLSSPEWKFL